MGSFGAINLSVAEISWRIVATARKKTLGAVKLAHADAPFESAADRCDFAYFDRAALCASAAERYQVKGGRAESRRHHW